MEDYCGNCANDCVGCYSSLDARREALAVRQRRDALAARLAEVDAQIEARLARIEKLKVLIKALTF